MGTPHTCSFAVFQDQEEKENYGVATCLSRVMRMLMSCASSIFDVSWPCPQLVRAQLMRALRPRLFHISQSKDTCKQFTYLAGERGTRKLGATTSDTTRPKHLRKNVCTFPMRQMLRSKLSHHAFGRIVAGIQGFVVGSRDEQQKLFEGRKFPKIGPGVSGVFFPEVCADEEVPCRPSNPTRDIDEET